MNCVPVFRANHHLSMPSLDRGWTSLSVFVLPLAVPVIVEGFVLPGAAGRFVPVQSAVAWIRFVAVGFGSAGHRSGVGVVGCWVTGIGTPLFLSRSEAIPLATAIARKPGTTKATPKEMAFLLPGRSRTTNSPTP
jgi:hypothetical protein